MEQQYLEEVQESGIEIEDLWNIIHRRRWCILSAWFLCWAVVWAISWLLPAQYRSETLILIEQQKIPQEYVLSNVGVDFQQRLQTMTQQILSRTRLQRIIDELRLYPRQRNRMSPDELVELMRKDIEIQLVETPSRKEVNAFRVYYSAPTPQLAQRVAKQLTSLFIQENLLAQQQQSEDTTQFLSAELEQARVSLAEQETKVREFKARYLGQLPSQMQSNVGILTGLQSRYEGLTTSLSHTQQQKLYLESLLNQYQALGIMSPQNPQAPGSVDQDLERLNTELAAAQARYTEEHPEVTRLKNQIAGLEKLKKQGKADAGKGQGGSAASTKATSLADLQAMSPILQLQSQLKANEQEIKDTQAQLKAVEQQIQQYQTRLNMLPVREQQLADLSRDYDQSRANYDSLLKKQIQSQLATNLEKRQEGAQFRVLDPPSLPEAAFWPNRIKFSLGGLGGGLVFGLVLAFCSEKISGRARTENDLREILAIDYPGIEIVSARVLVGIPHMPVPGEERRKKLRRTFEYAAAVVLLMGVALGNALSLYKG
jgi:polysaccharide chain length determinant protein (PEP-CTERM system associated)